MIALFLCFLLMLAIFQIFKLKKRLTTQCLEKKSLLESLSEGVLILNKKSFVKEINFSAARLLFLSKRKCLGKKLKKENSNRRQELIEKVLHLSEQALKTDQLLTDSFSSEEVHSHKVAVDLIIIPLKNQKSSLVLLQDKSSQYKTLQLGRDFVANASHELRTPITIIKGFTETLCDIPNISPDMFQNITGKILRNCQRMENLIKNLLLLADIEHLPISRFKECALLPLLERTRELVLVTYPHAEIKIQSADDNLQIYADFDLLELTFTNLISNAAKYSPSPAKIDISLRSSSDEIIIEIQDQGMGIPETDLTYIFERFYTVDKTHSRRLGGAGLGLSLVKTIIDKHEGTISVKSKIEQGTCFTLVLPSMTNCLA